ncbi:CBS domain-containing protein [Lentzea nigeriaca]|uniref:CBS domain-containing protein n=1 Tax=Lentzea nigeriaca TaxID=1128665 RepID=UPI0019566E0B|nr:CBS domain-containing protein [Lentzea nigeriaca]MBM7864672.1 CBS domain-containing protein [Lentzea nigeriaca]
MKARDVATGPLVTVGPRDFARHAEGLMDDFGLTMLPVVDEDVFLGVVTKAACAGASGKVEHVMSQPVLTFGPETDAATLYDAMTLRGALSVPILDDGRIVGVVTTCDVLRAISHGDPHLRVGPAGLPG